MPPTPPSHDDALDLDGLDLKSSGTKKPADAESDFEKELEALFAEDLAASDEKPASAPPVGAPETAPAPAAAPAAEDDALLLDDLVGDAPAAESAGDEDILDLGSFAEGGAFELSPPDETPGGKDGVIDLTGLDEIITGLGDSSGAAAAPATETAPAAAEPLDSTEMADLLENLDIPAAAPSVEEPGGEDLLDLSLGDLVEEATAMEPQEFAAAEPAAEPVVEPAVEDVLDLSEPILDLAEPLAEEPAAAAEESVLDLTLPDLSDPEPGRDLVAEQEQADLGGDLNLSLDDVAAAASAADATEAPMDQLLGEDLGMDGLMEGIEPAAEEPAPEVSLDAESLLAQIPDATLEAALAEATTGDAETLAEEIPVETAAEEPLPELLEPVAPGEEIFTDEPVEMPDAAAEAPSYLDELVPQADAALLGAAAGVAVGAAAAATAETGAAASPAIDQSMLAELTERLAQLATQVTGNSVAVVRLEGKLAEREKNLAELEERFKASQEEAQALREELAALRANMEESLRAQDENVQQELAQAAQAAADKSQAAMDKALGAVDKALVALDKAQVASDKVDSLAPRVESAEMTVRGAGARLTQVENRQAQLDREVFAEITRAVPREAAKVIREEIAHLAASMRDE